MWNMAKPQLSEYMSPMINLSRVCRDKSFSLVLTVKRNRLLHGGIVFPFDVCHSSSGAGSWYNPSFCEIRWVRVVIPATYMTYSPCLVSIHALYHSRYFSGPLSSSKLRNHLSCSSSKSELSLWYCLLHISGISPGVVNVHVDLFRWSTRRTSCNIL